MPGKPNLELGALKKAIERLAGALLGDYARDITSGRRKFGAKEINDPVWGTIRLYPIEVAVMDSPLFQRLRYVKQLGVVHWVYPGAVHTRFDHSVGVLNQVDRLVTAVQTQFQLSHPGYLIEPKLARVVRLAALLHDIGHGVFSHVSENAISDLVPFRQLIVAFSKSMDVEDRKISEIAAYYMVGSPAFRNLLTALITHVETDALPDAPGASRADQIAKTIQRAIIGLPISDKIPTLHEFISGPFDADKLDYTARDAMFAGVPRIVDISRLIQKVSSLEMREEQLPQSIAATVKSGEPSYYLIGIKWSGISVLDELHLARSLLFSKIYKHKKVQAIEVMFGSVFRHLASQLSSEDIVDILYLCTDEEVLALDAKTVKAVLSAKRISTTGVSVKTLEPALDIIGRIRRRELFVSAFVIQSKYPGDTRQEASTQINGLRNFMLDVRNSDRARAIVETLVADLNVVANATGIDLTVGGRIAPDSIEQYVQIARPVEPSGDSEISRAFIFQADGTPVRHRDSIFNTEGWSKAYGYSAGSEGYVYTIAEFATLLFIVIEKYLWQRYQVVLPPSAYLLSKQDVVAVETVKVGLAKANYYKSVGFEIRPWPERLRRADIKSRIVSLEKKFSVFQDPIIGVEGASGPVDSDRILRWLRQFEDDASVEGALYLLERFRLLDRADAVATVKGFIDANPRFKNAVLCGFGSAKDSSAVVSYYARDVPPGYISAVHSIEEAASVSFGRPVILFDDICASGGQAKDILGHWFEVDDLKMGLGEQRLPFHQKEKEFLKKSDTAIVYVAGWDEGIKEAADAARRVGMSAITYSHLKEVDIPFAFESKILSLSDEAAANFKEKCRAIGEQLIASQGEDKKQNRSLGHGNRAMLMASTFNMPAQTITCMRESGHVDGVEWRGLFTRRKKT